MTYFKKSKFKKIRYPEGNKKPFGSESERACNKIGLSSTPGPGQY